MDERLVNADGYAKGTKARQNPWSSEEPGDIDGMIESEDFTVVNAPRPLPGEIEWQGEFLHGIFYAAGDFEKFGEQWESLDAHIVRLVNDEDVKALVCKRAAEHDPNLNIDKFVADGKSTWGELAHMYGLPFNGN